MVSEVGRRHLLSVSLVASVTAALLSSSALLLVLVAWPLGAAWARATRPASTALLALLALDVALGVAVAVRSAFLAWACRARDAPRKVRLLHPVGTHLVCLLLPSVLLNLVVVVWCVVGMALSPRLSRSRILWAALGYYEGGAAREVMDETQSVLECCGYDGPADWHPWANDPIGALEQMDLKKDAAEALTAKARPGDSDIPESCCVRDDVEGPPAPAHTAAAAPADGATAACRTWDRGCFKPLANTLVLLHLSVGTVSLVLAALLSLVAATLRLAQTSAKAALESGDPTAPAPAWLFRFRSGHDAVPMRDLAEDDNPGPGPGGKKKAGPHRSRPGMGRRREASADSDSDPDLPDKLLFTRTPRPARVEQAVMCAHALSTSSTSSDSTFTFELTETPLPTSEERFILAEYAFSPGLSPGTSTTSSWDVASESGNSSKGFASLESSPRSLRRSKSDGDVPRDSTWTESSLLIPKRKLSNGVRKMSRTSSEQRGGPQLMTADPPKPCDTARPSTLPGHHAEDVVPTPGRASTLLDLEREVKQALMQAAAQGTLPTTVHHIRPTRITSESSTQTNPAGQSMPSLDELFREHGITSRTQSKSSQGAPKLLPRAETARTLGAGDDVSPTATQVLQGVRKLATSGGSDVSLNVHRGPIMAAWSTSVTSETADDGGVQDIDAPLPPVPEQDRSSELESAPLPPLPLPTLAKRRFARSRRRHAWGRPALGAATSSSDGEPHSTESPRDRRRPVPWRRARASRGRSTSGLRAVALWVQGSRPEHGAASSSPPGSSLDHSSSSDTTSDSSSSSSPQLGAPPPTPSSSLASTSAPRGSSASLVDGVVEVATDAAERTTWTHPREHGDDLPPRRPWNISVDVSKSAVAVALLQSGRSVLYRISMAWLLSELGACTARLPARNMPIVELDGATPSVRQEPVDVIPLATEQTVTLDYRPCGKAARALLSTQAAAQAGSSSPVTAQAQGDMALDVTAGLKATLHAALLLAAAPRPPHAPLEEGSHQTDHHDAVRAQGHRPRAPHGASASKWRRKSRRQRSLDLHHLLRDGGFVRLVPSVRGVCPPGHSVSDSGAGGRSDWRPGGGQGVRGAGRSAPTVGQAPAPPAPRSNPYWSSAELTLDRRKSDEDPPSPPSPRGCKRSPSPSETPLPKIMAVCPPPPRQRVQVEIQVETLVETVPLRRTAPSLSLTSSSSDQCPHCDCWRRRRTLSPDPASPPSELCHPSGEQAVCGVPDWPGTLGAEETDESSDSHCSSLTDRTTSALLLLARRF